MTAPDANDLQALVEQIAARVGQVLERRGPIERDIENAWLSAGSRWARGPGRSSSHCRRLPHACSGQMKIIASIEDPQVIGRILSHLERTAPEQHEAELPRGARAPPVQSRPL